MTEKLNEETVWFLKQMVERAEKDLSEGKVYTHEEVKSLIRAKFHEDNVVTACAG